MKTNTLLAWPGESNEVASPFANGSAAHPPRRILAVLLATALWPWWCHGQTVTQSLTLQPGWNAVFLEVDLADKSPTSVLTNLPIESVWTQAGKVGSAEFIQDPSEAGFNRGTWLAWFAPNRPEAFLSNLRALQPLRAYLIKVGGSQPVPLTLVGPPVFRPPVWAPDAYTLLGFPADGAAPPTFWQYFQHSPAHVDPGVGPASLQAYRLVAGHWTRVDPGEPIQRGEAYWVHTRGASDYAGPLSLALDFGDGLRFADSLAELPLNFRNLTTTPLSLRVVEQVGSGNPALSYHQFDAAKGNQWLSLSEPWLHSCAAGERGRLRVAIRRQDLSGNTYAAVLRVNDGAGSEWFIPVTAQRPDASHAARLVPMGAGRQDVPDAVRSRAGLWVGSATINAVSEAHSADPAVPTPTRSTFSLRLLIHLDAAGQARLLKEVIQMWQNGTYTNDAAGGRTVDRPGRYVLLTDDRLIGQFSGSAIRDGTPVGRRLSSLGYDFPTRDTNNFVALSGLFDFGQSLSAALTMPHDAPTNPYKHKFHPDHDNLNARFDGPAVEDFEISRQIELEFTAAPPSGTPPTPDYGYSTMGGVYRETIRGLHKQPLHVGGQFVLNRVSLVSDLNPSPNP